MTADVKLMTAEELLTLLDDGMRHELVEGELRTISPSFGRHSMIAGRIAAHLGAYVRATRLGEILVGNGGYVLRRSPDTLHCPDVSFVAKGREIGDAFIEGAPDLAFEVISWSDTYSEIEAKVFDYLEAGCSMVVLVDPRLNSANVHIGRKTVQNIIRLSIDDALDGGDVVPGWKLPLRELFE